ncbi:MAG: aldehyde dehydrogenase [Acidimicrobiales bacterium]|nr:aldehyde dehydrogenase [Acidimicrobiales bacterium]
MVIERSQLFIGGEWLAPASGDTFEVHSPHDQSLVAVVPKASNADADAALQAARAALDAPWSTSSTPKERAELIRSLSAAIQARGNEVTSTVTAEMGTPAKFAMFGHLYAATTVLDGYAELVENYTFEEQRSGVISPTLIQKVPVGVAVGIVPWNVPMVIAAFKLGAALASGSPIVLKPSPEAPVSSFVLADALADIDLPPGLVSILPGDADLGRHLVSHPLVDKVSFTGSTAAGRSVGATCGELLKRCTLELGGKSAGIVLDDADLATTVPQLLDAGLQNNGQVCAAQTRLLVPRSRHAEIVDAFADHMRSLAVGNPADPSTDIGPLVAERQRERVEGYIKAGVDEGAKLVVGGGRPSDLDSGWYVEPTLFDDVDNQSRIAREEIFGPVLAVVPYDDDDHAVALANDSDFGLSGSVWTSDADRGVAVASRVRTGLCAINSGLIVDPKSPFGGFKASGIGREMGPEGLSAFLETRTVVLPPG